MMEQVMLCRSLLCMQSMGPGICSCSQLGVLSHCCDNSAQCSAGYAVKFTGKN